MNLSKVEARSRLAQRRLARTYDLGESLRVRGRKIAMRRSLEKVAIVQTSDETDTVPTAMHVRGRQYHVEQRMNRLKTVILTTNDLQSSDEMLISMRDLAAQPVRGRVVPVYIREETGLQMVPTGDIVVKLVSGRTATHLEAIAKRYGAAVKQRLGGTPDQFILAVPHDSAEELFDLCVVLESEPAVQWAEPDFIAEVTKCDVRPDDPFFETNQWHLDDIDVPNAWETTTGSDQVVIAVIDDGVDIDHEDLQSNIFLNDDPINGIDDDGNGWVDDWCGWDFWNNTPDPRPNDPNANHGTAVAGVTVAVGDNNEGVTGCAYGCKLMPLKHTEPWTGPQYWTAVRATSEAIYYAAGRTRDGLGRWRGADVISISWTWSPVNQIDDALEYAAREGRNGKGCPIFCSAGNQATGYVPYKLWTTGLPAGEYRLEFTYAKDRTGAAGEDALWIADVILPDAVGTHERFDSPVMPYGWSGAGHRGFSIVNDPAHAYGTGCYVARSGEIGDSQVSVLRTRPFQLKPGSPLTFRAWVSTEKGNNPDPSFPPLGVDGDWFYVMIRNTVTGNAWYWTLDAGMPGDRWNVSGPAIRPGIGYPASHPDTMAVGASTDLGYRADYSRHGAELDFVAPSSGGLRGIATTDRTGAPGYDRDGGDYDLEFGGTSAAAPLAAGVAALVLSANPALIADEVRTTLWDSCDKIGYVPYNDGWNPFYGYGRISARMAVDMAIAASQMPISRRLRSHTREP